MGITLHDEVKKKMSLRTHIRANQSWLHIPWKEIWEYRDLLWNLICRDFVTVYKQTILGPVWFVFQPLATTLIFTIIFGNLAGLSTEGTPKLLFYMSGIMLWTYFQGCMEAVANCLSVNAPIFGKVYFPRLIPPLAIVINNLARLGLNLIIFMLFWIYYYFVAHAKIDFNPAMLTLPLLVIYCAFLGLGIGLLLTSMTAKYRDLVFVIPFLGQIWMYLTPVPYSVSIVSAKYQWLFCFNPMASVIEINRYAFLGTGTFSACMILCNLAITSVLMLAGLLLFNKVQRTFIDTI